MSKKFIYICNLCGVEKDDRNVRGIFPEFTDGIQIVPAECSEKHLCFGCIDKLAKWDFKDILKRRKEL